MDNRLRLGVILIAIGLAGLLFLGGISGGAPGGPGWRRHHGPMMRGFGGPHMYRPWGRPGAGPQQLPPVAGARTIDIVATDFSSKPAEVSVKVGEVVNLRLINQGVTVHDIVVPAQGIWIVTPAGQSVASGIRFDRPGEYEFFCSVPGHREAGMIGRIVVTP